MAKKNYKEFMLTVHDLHVPVKIYKERRNSIRASLGKKHAILRLPSFISKKGEQEQIDRFYNWLKDKVLVNDRFRQRFKGKKYRDGYEFSMYDQNFVVYIVESDNKNHSAKYIGAQEIQIKLGDGSTIRSAESEITRLISRVIAQHYKRDITGRVLSINNDHFQKEIKSVRLKYNRSNWGSCSTSSNINLSTRLLFAPVEVQNYVIIHELSHLSEMNHSPRFWKIVSDIMPDYKQKEKWLKENGHLCDFGL